MTIIQVVLSGAFFFLSTTLALLGLAFPFFSPLLFIGAFVSLVVAIRI